MRVAGRWMWPCPSGDWVARRRRASLTDHGGHEGYLRGDRSLFVAPCSSGMVSHFISVSIKSRYRPSARPRRSSPEKFESVHQQGQSPDVISGCSCTQTKLAVGSKFSPYRHPLSLIFCTSSLGSPAIVLSHHPLFYSSFVTVRQCAIIAVCLSFISRSCVSDRSMRGSNIKVE